MTAIAPKIITYPAVVAVTPVGDIMLVADLTQYKTTKKGQRKLDSVLEYNLNLSENLELSSNVKLKAGNVYGVEIVVTLTTFFNGANKEDSFGVDFTENIIQIWPAPKAAVKSEKPEDEVFAMP